MAGISMAEMAWCVFLLLTLDVIGLIRYYSYRRSAKFSVDDWVQQYARRRYARSTPDIQQVLLLL